MAETYEHFFLSDNRYPELSRLSDTEAEAMACRGDIALLLIDKLRDLANGRRVVALREFPKVEVHKTFNGPWVTRGTCRVHFKEGSESFQAPSGFVEEVGG